MEGQREIAKTIASMTKLSLENATLEEILPVLMQAVKAFTSTHASLMMTMLTMHMAPQHSVHSSRK